MFLRKQSKNKTADGLRRYIVNGPYYSITDFQNIVRFHSVHVIVIHLHPWEERTSFLPPICTKLLNTGHYLQMSYAEMLSKWDKFESMDWNSFTFLLEVWSSRNPFYETQNCSTALRVDHLY
jgi:hypothetical protein